MRLPRLMVAAVATLAALAACQRKDAVSAKPNAQTPALDYKASEIRVADKLYKDRLLEGFYSGTDDWLWTGRQFAVSVDVPPPANIETRVNLDFSIPEELIHAAGPVTVTARANGTKIGSQKYTAAGRYLWEKRLPASVLSHDPVKMEYSLDHWATDPPRDAMSV